MAPATPSISCFSECTRDRLDGDGWMAGGCKGFRVKDGLERVREGELDCFTMGELDD